LPAEHTVPHTVALAAFALGNVNRSWRRAVPVILSMSVVAAAGLVAGPGALRSHLAREAARRDDGALIIVADSAHGLDAAACERLVLTRGIVHAGALSSHRSAEVRPGLMAQAVDVTPGFVQLISLGRPPRSTRRGPATVILGRDLAERLSMRSPNAMEGILLLRAHRTDPVVSAQMRLVAPVGHAQECWVETTPAAFELSSDVITAALLLPSPDLRVRNLRFDGGPREFDSWRTRVVPFVAAAALSLMSLAFVRLRRIELSMYRLLGLPSHRAAAIILVEQAVLVVAALTLATSVWLMTVSRGRRVTQPVIEMAASNLIHVVLVVAAVVCPCTLWMARRAQQIKVLREGA
jgi:hypothetical protein